MVVLSEFLKSCQHLAFSLSARHAMLYRPVGKIDCQAKGN